MTKIKRKITKINDSAADSAVADEVPEMQNSKSKTAAAPAAAAVPAAPKGRAAKAADVAVPPSPGSDTSSEVDRPTTMPVSSMHWEPIPHAQSFTGMGKKQNRKPKAKPADENEGMAMKKRWTKRPQHWREIAEYYKNNSLEATLVEYADDLGDFSTVAQYHKLHSWKKEMENDIDVRIQPPGREPAYGNEIDRRLHEAVMVLLKAGHPVDDATLRGELVKLLTEEGRADLLIENGGTCVFQTSWAARFWKRHEAESKELRMANIAVAQQQLGEVKDAQKAEKSRRKAEHIPEEVDNKKPWTRRPENWQQMAEYFAEQGISNTLAAFKDELGHLSYSAAYQKLNNWRNDMISQRELHSPGRPPNYGELIDNQLLAIVQDRIKTGQTVDDFIMREILVDLLTAVGKETMLRENGGECTFGHSWAVRFRKRHNLPTKDQNARKRKRGGEDGDDDASVSRVMAQVSSSNGTASGSVAAAAVAEAAGSDSEEEPTRVEFTRGTGRRA